MPNPYVKQPSMHPLHRAWGRPRTELGKYRLDENFASHFRVIWNCTEASLTSPRKASCEHDRSGKLWNGGCNCCLGSFFTDLFRLVEVTCIASFEVQWQHNFTYSPNKFCFFTCNQFCKSFGSVSAFGNHSVSETFDRLLFGSFSLKFRVNNATDR